MHVVGNVDVNGFGIRGFPSYHDEWTDCYESRLLLPFEPCYLSWDSPHHSLH